MFKSGVLTDGELNISDEGVVQGSICSPIIANIFSHEVISTWMEETVKAHCVGEVKIYLYADDMVICCQNKRDAERIKIALGRRLGKYGLKLNKHKCEYLAFKCKGQPRLADATKAPLKQEVKCLGCRPNEKGPHQRDI